MIPLVFLVMLIAQPVYELDEIVVTATRYPTALQDIALATIVIDREELDERVLEWVPEGVSLEDFARTNLVGTPEDCLKQLRQYAILGVTHFMLFFGDLPDLRGLKLFAEKVVGKIDQIT